MSRISVMMKKDLRFCGKWLIPSAAVLILAALFFQYSSLGQSMPAEWSFAAGCVFGVMPFLYRTFSLEDNPETQSFLRAIPILPEIQVYGKYAMTAALCIAAFILTAAAWIAIGMTVTVKTAAVAFALVIGFHSLTLLVFYKSGIQLLQQCYAFFFLGVFCIGRFHISIDLTIGYLPWLIMAAALVLYVFSAKRAAFEVL